MDDAEYGELAREYGLGDTEDYERYHMETELAGNAQQAMSTDSYYAAYDDIEDFEDDTGNNNKYFGREIRTFKLMNGAAFSSPSPPERALGRYQPGHHTQYQLSQNTYARSPHQASRSFPQARVNARAGNTGTFVGCLEPISQQIHHHALTVPERGESMTAYSHS